jgi:AcrR family transcriptional regulator
MKTLSLTKRTAMIKAGKAVFFKHGFACASMDVIAREANVSKATIYKHFHDKHELFKAIIDEHWVKLAEVSSIDENNTKSPKSVLTEAGLSILNFLLKPETMNFFRLLVSESERFPTLNDSILKNTKPPITYNLCCYLAKQHERKLLKIIDPVIAAKDFLGLLKENAFWHVMIGVAKKPSLAERERAVKHAVDVFLGFYGV